MLALSTFVFGALVGHAAADWCGSTFEDLQTVALTKLDCKENCTKCQPLLNTYCTTCKKGDDVNENNTFPEFKFEDTIQTLKINMEKCNFDKCPTPAVTPYEEWLACQKGCDEKDEDKERCVCETCKAQAERSASGRSEINAECSPYYEAHEAFAACMAENGCDKLAEVEEKKCACEHCKALAERIMGKSHVDAVCTSADTPDDKPYNKAYSACMAENGCDKMAGMEEKECGCKNCRANAEEFMGKSQVDQECGVENITATTINTTVSDDDESDTSTTTVSLMALAVACVAALLN